MLISFLKLIIVFPIIIFLLVYVLKLMQKYIQPQSLTKSMQVMQQIKLSSKTNLSVVKVGAQYLVIAYNDEHIEIVTKLSDEEGQEFEAHTQQQLPSQLFIENHLTEKLKRWKGWRKNAKK